MKAGSCGCCNIRIGFQHTSCCHHSFLVLIDDKELLLKEMQSAYTSVFGKNIVIDTNKAKFMLMPPPDHFEVDEMTAYSGWLERNEAADQFYGRCI